MKSDSRIESYIIIQWIIAINIIVAGLLLCNFDSYTIWIGKKSILTESNAEDKLITLNVYNNIEKLQEERLEDEIQYNTVKSKEDGTLLEKHMNYENSYINKNLKEKSFILFKSLKYYDK